MKKVTIKGVDGKELEAYICSDHPKNFPTDMTNHEVEDIPQNNLNELDVNENSAGGGAHISFNHAAHISPDGDEESLSSGTDIDCHTIPSDFKTFADYKDESIYSTPEYPAMVNSDATEEEIKEWVANKKKIAELNEAANYESPLDIAFQYGGGTTYNIDVDPLSKLFKMVSKKFPQNKVKIDDTIDSDFLETGDLRLGRLYRVAGVDLVVRFAGSFVTTVPDGNKVLLQIKHHGTVLYVEEKQLMKACDRDVKEYLNQPF